VDPDRCLVSFPTDFWKTRSTRCGGAPLRFRTCSAFDWCCCCRNGQASAMRKRPRSLVSPRGKCNAGGDVGSAAISASRMTPGAARSRLFPLVDRAAVIAMACEAVAETELPISRQSVADLAGRAQKALGKPISASTVWRTLHEDAIKPWQYEHWIFPRDPLFAEKADRIQTQRRLAILGNLGRAARHRDGPLRKTNGHSVLWPHGDAHSESGTVLRCGAFVLGRGQWLVAPRPTLGGANASA
jgi:hypothetical protein